MEERSPLKEAIDWWYCQWFVDDGHDISNVFTFKNDDHEPFA
jgi:hypothetical protein